MIHLTIDEKPIEVPEGTTVLQAARASGIRIPTLCDHPHLTPYGGCRLCVVEVKGARTLQASCTLPATENMVVRTDTPQIREARQAVLSLIFSERNHFCPYCQVSGGDCELQNAAYGEGMTHWPIQPIWDHYPVDASHPDFILEHNRCILCRRCVRACAELVGNFTLGLEERGYATRLTADAGVPLGESTCIACGMCVQVCPTGALIDRRSAYLGHDTQVTRTRTVCVGCSVGCGIQVVTRNNQIVRIEGDWDSPVNDGILCRRGRYAPLDEARERLTTPLVRKDGALQPATWDEALSAVADRFTTLRGSRHDGVAALVSTRLPAEALSAFKQLFADGLGSDAVTSIEEGMPTAAPAALADELGQPIETALDALRTTECVIVIGTDLSDRHEVAGYFVKRRLLAGVKVIAIDPHCGDCAAHTDYSIQIREDSDLEVIRCLQAASLRAGIGAAPGATFDADDVLKTVPESIGLTAEAFEAAARIIAGRARPVILYGKGITAQGGAQTMKALRDWAAQIGAGLISVKGEANSLAASQYGLDRVFTRNGHQAVYVALGDDYPTERLVKRLDGAPFVVAQASHASPLTERADVVLPVTAWSEQGGHYVNLDGHVQEARPALTAPDGVKSNAETLRALAGRLGVTVNDDWKAGLLRRTPIVALTEG